MTVTERLRREPELPTLALLVLLVVAVPILIGQPVGRVSTRRV